MVLTELLDKGGVVMVIILLLSVYVLAVILFKLFQFWRNDVFNNAFIYDVLKLVSERKIKEAARVSNEQRNPIARVLETTLQCVSDKKMPDDKKIKAIEAAGSSEIRIFESHLRGIEMVANIAPLLGLLGTVIGMVKAFSSIEKVGSKVDPSILAGGIWEALLTTVAGLAVAIPALAAFYMIDGRIEKMRSSMKEAVSFIISKS